LLPVATGVLEPIEIIGVLEFVSFNKGFDFKELITLIDLNRNESFDLGTDEFGHVVAETHFGQLAHNALNLFTFLGKI